MSESIQCNFARCAIHYFTSTKHTKRKQKLPKGTMPLIVQNYNKHFATEENLQVSYSQASKKFPVIYKLFANKWHPKELRETYLSVFSVEAWSTLAADEKAKHALHNCSACRDSYPNLNAVFPKPRRRAIKATSTLAKSMKTIELSTTDLSTPSNLGRKVLQDLNKISQDTFQKSGQEVLIMTPHSELQKKLTKQERKKQKREVEKEVKSVIEKVKQDCASDIVLGNRISWSVYEKIRKTEGLELPQKRSAGDQTTDVPITKRRKHGNIGQIDQTQLLNEAASWSPNETVNWSFLARQYGITKPNGGQIIMEFLQEHKVPAALMAQRPTRAPRRCKKKLRSGKVSFPMYPTAMTEHNKIHQRIEKGEIEIGTEVLTATQSRYSVNKHTNSVEIENVEVGARKIPLLQIREQLLKKHEALGIVRDLSEEYFEGLSMNQVITRLQELAIPFNTGENSIVLRQQLKDLSRKRHIKIWHDHSSISAHGHLLLLVSIMYSSTLQKR